MHYKRIRKNDVKMHRKTVINDNAYWRRCHNKPTSKQLKKGNNKTTKGLRKASKFAIHSEKKGE